MTDTQSDPASSADHSRQTAVTTNRSNIKAGHDVKIVGTEETHLTERPLTAVEEERQAAEFARQDLAQAVQAYAKNLQTAAAGTTDGDEPYRGLLDYDCRQASLFFGRTQAIDDFLGCLERHNLTVLHAASGVGKSSLLKAGIIPRLIAAGHLPIFVRSNQNPSLTIKRALLPDVDQIPTLARASLRSFLWQVRNNSDLAPTTNIYIFLDQFEEFFTQLDNLTRDKFLRELAECLDDTNLQVYWVLSLRKEYLSDLADFKTLIKNPLGNEYRLDFLTLEETEEAIVEPALQHDITFEPGLLERLLDDLSVTGYYPPHIQLVCQSLYRNRPKDQTVITLDLYVALGETAGILRNYFNRALKNFPPEKQILARRLLEFLIDSNNHRVPRTMAELTAELVVDEKQKQQLQSVLDELINDHLLRRTEINRTDTIVPVYELVHDYLIAEVNLDPEVKARKVVKEMLDQEVYSYHRFGTLLSRNKQELIEARLEPADIKPDAQILLLHSAIALNHNIDYWMQHTSAQSQGAALQKGLNSPDTATRQRAAALANDPRQIEPLVKLMQSDDELLTRQNAALSLARLDKARFASELAQLCGNRPTFPKHALELMAYVEDEQLDLIDFNRLLAFNRLTPWRMRWLRINQNWPTLRLIALYAGLGGAAGGLLGGLLGGAGLFNASSVAMFGSIYGLGMAGGAGFGFGLAKVMNKRQTLWLYIVGAMLFGSLLPSLIGFFDADADLIEHLVGILFGLGAGGFCGATTALIIRSTAKIEPLVNKRIIRAGLSLVAGAILGLWLVAADRFDVFPPGQDHWLYGFCLGMLLMPGTVIIGMDWLNQE